MSRHREHQSIDGSCAEVEPWIELCVDGELAEPRRRRLDRHLRSCASCREQMALARRMQSSFRTLRQPPCPAPVSRAVFAATVDATSAGDQSAPVPFRRRGGRPWLRPAWQTALAALLLTALGLATFGRAPRPVEPSPQQVDQAQADVELALAYLGRIGERTSTAVIDDVLDQRVADPIVRSVGQLLGQEPAS